MAVIEATEPRSTSKWRPRRQNQSCDACRSAKRRCTPSECDPGAGQSSVCNNCVRLGHKCTYESAQARRQHQSKRKASKNSDPVNFTDPCVIAPADPVLIGTQVEHSEQQRTPEYSPARSNVVLDVEPDFCLPWMSSDLSPFDELFKEFIGVPASGELMPLANNVADSYSTMSRYEVGQLLDEPSPSLLPHVNRIPPTRLSRPALLLSSSLSDSMVGAILARIYNSIVARNSMRWLRFEANPYASDSPYSLLSDDVLLEATNDGNNRTLAVSDLFQDQSSKLPAPTAIEAYNQSSVPKVANRKPPMSLLGAVRFLDHFSDLYGNKLDTYARRISDSAIKTTLTAYSMQWLPAQANAPKFHNSENISFPHSFQDEDISLKAAYYQSWKRAKGALENSLGLRSFRIIYSTLLFDATAAPAEEQDAVTGKNALLNTAFYTLQVLSDMVTNYAKTLGPSSEYSRLLMTSLAVVRWFGQLRDITSSLINPRRPRPTGLLPQLDQKQQLELGLFNAPKLLSVGDVPPAQTNSESFSYHLDKLDQSVREFLRQHNPRLLSISQAICMMKADLTDEFPERHFTVDNSFEVLLCVTSAIDSLRAVMGSLLEDCIEHLDLLSAESKLLVAILVLLWNLGLLTISEIPHRSIGGHATTDRRRLLNTLRAYQRTATSAITRLSAHLLADPFPEESILCDDLDVETRMTGYHIAPDLAVVAVRKAIEAHITLEPTRTNADFDHQDPQSDDDTNVQQWKEALDKLLKGLLALKASIGGSQSAGLALESLLQKYGDILSECWSADFET